MKIKTATATVFPLARHDAPQQQQQHRYPSTATTPSPPATLLSPTTTTTTSTNGSLRVEDTGERVGVWKSYRRLPPMQRLVVSLSFLGLGFVGLYCIGDEETLGKDVTLGKDTTPVVPGRETTASMEPPRIGTQLPIVGPIARFYHWSMDMARRDWDASFPSSASPRAPPSSPSEKKDP